MSCVLCMLFVGAYRSISQWYESHHTPQIEKLQVANKKLKQERNAAINEVCLLDISSVVSVKSNCDAHKSDCDATIQNII